MLAPQILRERTKQAHAGLEQTAVMAPLSGENVSQRQYQDALAALYGFYSPAERLLYAQSPCEAVAMGIGAKAPALRQDLLALGMAVSEIEALPLCADLPLPDGAARQLGMLYVLEGATLGGQVIRKRLVASFAEKTPDVTHFHGFHGDGAGPWWKRFQSQLAEKLDIDPIATEAAVQSALETFASLECWLSSAN